MSEQEKTETRELTIGMLDRSKESINILLRESLPISISWELMKFAKGITGELQTYEELRKQKIIELGEEVLDNGKPTGEFSVKVENHEKFYEILNELQSKVVDLKIPEIKASDLLNHKNTEGKSIQISSVDLINLEWMIK